MIHQIIEQPYHFLTIMIVAKERLQFMIQEPLLPILQTLLGSLMQHTQMQTTATIQIVSSTDDAQSS